MRLEALLRHIKASTRAACSGWARMLVRFGRLLPACVFACLLHVRPFFLRLSVFEACGARCVRCELCVCVCVCDEPGA